MEKISLEQCFQDAAERKNALTKPVEKHDVRNGDEFIGIIRLCTAASIGFVFRQKKEGREILGYPIYCVGDDNLDPKQIASAIQSSLEQKLEGKIPKATIEKLSEVLHFVLLKSYETIAPVSSPEISLDDLNPFYGMSTHHFDTVAKILSDDERFLNDGRINTNYFAFTKVIQS